MCRHEPRWAARGPHTERARRTGVVAVAQPRSVVACEPDNRFLIELFLTQCLQDLSDTPVNFLNDITIESTQTDAFEFPRPKQRDVRQTVRQTVRRLLQDPNCSGGRSEKSTQQVANTVHTGTRRNGATRA